MEVDESDLTELTDEEDKKNTGYRIKGALKAPRTSNYSAQALYGWIRAGEIELEPEYQRDVVWADTKQSKLIDSLLRNFYVPPIIFRTTQDEDGATIRTCIDGKQRLTSVRRFLDGEIPHVDESTKKKYWFKNKGTGGPKKTLLPEVLRKQFEQKQLVCVEYDDLKDASEREIFQRVQLGMPLLPAERMAAIVGPWPTYATELKTTYMPTTGGQLLQYLDVDRVRGKDFLLMAQLLKAASEHPSRCDFTTQRVEKWLQRTDSPSQTFKAEIKETFEKYLEVSERLSKKKIAPVEFIMVGVMIYGKRDLSVDRLTNLVNEFRTKLKATFTDLKINNKQISAGYDWLDSHGALKPKTGKRKKGADDEDEEEYRGGPSFNKQKQANTRSAVKTSSAAPNSSSSSSTPNPKVQSVKLKLSSTQQNASPKPSTSTPKANGTPNASRTNSSLPAKAPNGTSHPVKQDVPQPAPVASGSSGLSILRGFDSRGKAPPQPTPAPVPIAAPPQQFFGSLSQMAPPPATYQQPPPQQERVMTGALKDWFAPDNGSQAQQLQQQSHTPQPAYSLYPNGQQPYNGYGYR